MLHRRPLPRLPPSIGSPDARTPGVRALQKPEALLFVLWYCPPPPPPLPLQACQCAGGHQSGTHQTLRLELSPKGDKALNPVEAAQLLPHSGRRGGTRTASHCLSDTHNQGTELAMKVVRQARLELSGGSTPDLLRPLPLGRDCLTGCTQT